MQQQRIISKPLLLHLVGCLYYLYPWCTVKQTSDNEINLLIKYIKSVLWRVAKRLSYMDEARRLKVKQTNFISDTENCKIVFHTSIIFVGGIRHETIYLVTLQSNLSFLIVYFSFIFFSLSFSFFFVFLFLHLIPLGTAVRFFKCRVPSILSRWADS